jgi:hypothetical protein
MFVPSGDGAGRNRGASAEQGVASRLHPPGSETPMAHRRDRDRSIDSDPSTQGALSVPKSFEEPADRGGMHTEEGIERMLDHDARSDDDANVHPHEHPSHDRPTSAHVPEELAGEILALATQGGGSFLDDDDEESLEEHVDREALAAGIVPQLVGQATLESASITEESALELENPEDDSQALERNERPGRTGVHRVPRHSAR